MSLVKRSRIYTAEDVASRKTEKSCWVTYKGKVYDVTNFLADHPGGEEYILKYGGQDVESIMKDSAEHDHSDAAYQILQEYSIGKLGTEETSLEGDDWVAPDDFQPDVTDLAADYEKNEFLDLRKPLLWQMWNSNFSKLYYLKQVHQPRHLTESPRLFGWDILEMLTRTVWYVVPLVWLPISANLFLRSAVQFSRPIPTFMQNPTLPLSLVSDITTDALVKTTLCFFLGNLIWTILEYGMHRFLFHIDEMLPDHPIALTLHFTIHGVHHYLPMDRLRLVMPPVLFFILETPFTKLAYLLFPAAMANGIIAGSFTFYVLYDTMHYALHHTQLPAYLKHMKKYHLAHHYKNFELGFGVTSKLWDYVFNTVIPM